MTKVSFAVALAATAIALAAPALANDSTATTAAGGLVLTRSQNIDMREEDLFVSARQVRVRYVFRNTAAAPQTVTVAFPMPERNLGEDEYGNRAFPADFQTRVDGRPVRMDREVRAFLNGREITAELNRLRVPLTPGTNADVNEATRAMDRLTAAQRQQLERAGIARSETFNQGRGDETHMIPLWTVREMWSWQQTFPVGRDLIVEHQYTPGAGGSVGSILTLNFPDGDSRRELAAYRQRYCIDQDFERSAQRLAREGGEAAGNLVPERTVRYILTTGGNWRSPIGRFRLVVDKGHPSNIVSFCGQGIRRISPTQFEMVRTNWRPNRDLDVLILGSAANLFPE